MQYEIFYLIGATQEPDTDKIKEEVNKIINKNGGVFEKKETQEKRRLSYQVKHETHGIYIAQRFKLEDNEKLKEITAQLNLNHNVLRFVLSKASDLPELKSKEERINEAARKETTAKFKKEKAQEKKEIKKESKREESKKIRKKKESSKKTATESIDKKLEEILNI